MKILRRISVFALVFAMLCACSAAFASAEQIVIDNETVTIPEGMGKVCEVDGRTFVPIRFVAEYLGCTVTYNDEQQSAVATNEETGISYFVICGNPELSDKFYVLPAFGDGTVIQMDTNVFINNDEARMYVPVRFFAQALGYDVEYNGTDVVLTSAPAETDNIVSMEDFIDEL